MGMGAVLTRSLLVQERTNMQLVEQTAGNNILVSDPTGFARGHASTGGMPRC